MTNRSESPASRRLACSGCGTKFTCDPSGACWCADETFRLPMPSSGADCLCPDCLRKAAARAVRGDRQGQQSIRINDQWRLCFVWRDGAAWDVELTD